VVAGMQVRSTDAAAQDLKQHLPLARHRRRPID
jgi:hypothetical protein